MKNNYPLVHLLNVYHFYNRLTQNENLLSTKLKFLPTVKNDTTNCLITLFNVSKHLRNLRQQMSTNNRVISVDKKLIVSG